MDRTSATGGQGPGEPASPFQVLRPADTRVPVVVHLPHASTLIPQAVRREVRLTDAELATETLRLTDWYTDELFGGLRDHGMIIFVGRLSRLVFDPERLLEVAAEPMEARGQGVVYWRDTQGRALRDPDPELRQRRIDALYRPYHAAFDACVAELAGAFGECTIIDGHSFPSLPLPSELDQDRDRADVCIGTDAFHTPPALASALVSAFSAHGWRVARDRPFRGTFVPTGAYRQQPAVRSVMIEVRRGLYMDEATGDRARDLPAVGAAIRAAIVAAIAATGE